MFVSDEYEPLFGNEEFERSKIISIHACVQASFSLCVTCRTDFITPFASSFLEATEHPSV